jgi:N-acetylglucosaminyl-diphospho-decaprenol L-rhamnosyltransferase
VAVVTHDSLADLRRSFGAQLELSRALNAPLVAVDNASADGTREFLRAAAEGERAVRLVEMPRNAGYATAVNRAAAEVPGKDLLLLNPDVEPSGTDAVERLRALLADRPRVAVAGPRLLYPDGGVQPSARRPASLVAMLGSLSPANRVGPLVRRYQRYLAVSYSDVPTAVDWVIGAAMLIRRRAFDELGGWDEGFFLYMEDADFCRRCARAGWKVVYLPAATMIHAYARASSDSDASVRTSAARRHHFASLARYWRKHPAALVGR